MLTVRPEDRRLLEQLIQQLQSATALMRGLLASQPRPTPQGDWGRGPAAPPVDRAPLMVGPRSVPDPPRPVDEPLERAQRARWRRHTPESLADDRRLVLGWVQELGLSVNRLAQEAGIAYSTVYRASHAQSGLSETARESLQVAVDRLRKEKKSHYLARLNPARGGTR
jgi:AraC-like DNA-binding protein